MLPYQSLPAPPNTISEAKILARLVDGIGFRYQLATAGFTQKEIDFCPIEGSMNMMELLTHIYGLITWTGNAFNLPYKRKRLTNFEELRTETLEVCQLFSQFLQKLSTEEVQQASVYLKRMDKHFSFWYLINGPLADALTHIGQINTWRRISGNPVARISPFSGDTY